MSIFHQIIPDVQTAGMAWSQHNRNDSEYLHPFGRKQQAVFCQCHHRNPTRNVKISEQKNCSEAKKMVPLTGLDYTKEHPASSRRVATVHRTVAFTWVRARRLYQNKKGARRLLFYSMWKWRNGHNPINARKARPIKMTCFPS